ncbi:outer membrane beta-barrel protein [Vibrio parahaemolyticus]
MKKFLFALLIPFFANASTIEPDGNEIISLRYSDTKFAGENQALFGIGFSHIRGAGNVGFTLSADAQNFDKDGNFVENVGKESESFQHYNIMGGLTYGVIDEFYVMPKIGFTYSKYKNKFADTNCSVLLGCQDFINTDRKDNYGISYGIDFMMISNSLAYGIGVTDVDYFDDRDVKLNLSVGYKF